MNENAIMTAEMFYTLKQFTEGFANSKPDKCSQATFYFDSGYVMKARYKDGSLGITISK